MSITAAPPRARADPTAALLDRLLDEVLEEQGGSALPHQVNALAAGVRDWRGGGRELTALVAGLPDPDAGRLVRACTMKLALANLADEHNRRGSGAYGAVRAAAELLRDADAIPPVDLRLVLTAHPTDIARRSVLTKQRTISRCLEALDDPRLSGSERRRLEDEIREALAIWLATNEVRSMQPRVADEVRRLLFFFESVLFEAAAELAVELTLATGSPFSSPPLRFGSWAGGDMDGNPEVGALSIRDTLRAHRTLALELLLERVVPLRQTFSQAQDSLEITDELRESLARDGRELPETSALLARRYPHEAREPLRRKLAFVAARLADDLSEARSEASGGHGYRVPERLLADLVAIRSCVGSRFVAGGRLERLIWQVRTFGFHLATLELRENAPEVQAACRALLPGYSAAADEPSRQAHLNAACGTTQVLPRDGLAEPRAAAALDCITRAHETYGTRCVDTFIVSNTEAPSDLLCVLWLARRAGVAGSLDLVPLFERRSALDRATETMSGLYESEPYVRQLEARGRAQEVMVGYSDAGKDAGYIASQWAIYRAQERLAAQARERKITLRLFQGRGGSPARGGGPADTTIGAGPPGTVDGQLKVTDQGEVITAKYRSRRSAVHSLAETLAAATRASTQAPIEIPARWRETLDCVADAAQGAYRALVFDEARFPEFFRHATPVDVLGELNLGSRPVARGGQTGIAELRAIPWVFAWTQSRVGLPGWYGAGAGLAAAPLAPLRDMYARWPFFAALLANLEHAVAVADMRIGAEYLGLAGGSESLARLLFDDYDRCVERLRAITGRDLAGAEPSLRQTWLEGLAFLQIALLRRFRGGEAAVREPLLATVAGIATGLRTTG